MSNHKLALSGCSFGWLPFASLDRALADLADHGFSTFELTTALPHVHSLAMDRAGRIDLARRLDRFGLRAVSTNPTFCDINLVSTNPDFRKLSEDQIARELELAAELGAETVVVIPGRLHALAPAPNDRLRLDLIESLTRLLDRADAVGVTIALENSPYGYLRTGGELADVADEVDHARLGIVYDVANALVVEDPIEGLATVAHRLVLIHLSDTWRDRWTHTSPGRGDVDFEAFARALNGIGYTGHNVYELIDMEPPGPRLDADTAAFEAAGFSRL